MQEKYKNIFLCIKCASVFVRNKYLTMYLSHVGRTVTFVPVNAASTFFVRNVCGNTEGKWRYAFIVTAARTLDYTYSAT
jgi:hypothetical protein